ncbi:MAG: hypothetical protein ABIB79_00160 [archaeon]
MNENFYPDEFDLDDHRLPNLVSEAALEIDGYLTNNKKLLETLEEPSSRLSKILNEKITEIEKIPGKSLGMSNYDLLMALKNSLQKHEERIRETPYKINHDVKTLNELRETLVPTIYRITENLKNYQELPKERQEVLRDFCCDLCGVSMGYTQIDYRIRLAA